MAVTRRLVRRLLVALAVLVLLGVGASACTEEAKTLDPEATQITVARSVAKQVGVKVTDVRCPAEIDRGKGKTVRCQAALSGGGVVRASVRQVDGDGRIEVRTLDAVMDRSKVALDLKIHLKATFGRSFQVSCETGRLVVRPGGQFRCTARDRTSRRPVEVTVADPAGTLRYRILPAT